MKKLPNRERYDAPPEGYKRYTAYVRIDLFVEFQKLAKQNSDSTKGALEKAIKWYINHGH